MEERMPDEELVELLKTDADRGMRIIVERYYEACTQSAQRALNLAEERCDVEDVVNETFEAAWKQLRRVTPDNLKAYLCGIAEKKALQTLRKKLNSRNGFTECSYDEYTEKIYAGNIDEPQGSYGPEGKVLGDELMAEVEAFLKTRTVLEREVYIRRVFGNRSVRETSEELNISESYVTTICARVRKALRDYLEARGLG